MSDFVQQQNSICDFNSSDSWVILSPIEQSIKRKIEAVGTPLKDWDIQINYGIKTGFNDAFIISTEKRNEILANCRDAEERKRTEELIRPILRGRDVQRYTYANNGLWLINTHNGVKGKIPRIDVEKFPAIKKHLQQYWKEISKRADKGDTPYNLRNCAYLDDFNKPKIVWKRVGSILRFSFDNTGIMALDSTCFATGEHIEFLVALLNSKMGHYLLKDSPKTGTGDLLISVQAIEPLKVPVPSEKQENSIKQIMFEIMNGNKQKEKDLNKYIYDLFKLSPDEVEFIQQNYS